MGEINDLLVIGGGINGTAIARAAAVAGQCVTLIEQGDLAQATSSASTKLMHGGLRYLEYYEFKLVREALQERGIMLRTAPHVVRPQQFILPQSGASRPWLVLRIGLLLYDFFARHGDLPSSSAVRVTDPALSANGARGFSYWDGRVDDSRLVLLNALDAAEAGATIRTRTRLLSAKRDKDLWLATVQRNGGTEVLPARSLINAAGPWADRVLGDTLAVPNAAKLRLVRGSHIVVPRCFAGDHAYLLQQADGRIVFTIPYQQHFTLIGTTDVTVERADQDHISPAETDYLLAAANRAFRQQILAADICHTFAGVRALYDDGSANPSAVSRDYHLELDPGAGAPLLSVYGGKLTTARHLAEVALQKLGCLAGDTAQRPLPGGDIQDFDRFLLEVERRWPFLERDTVRRLAHAYGTRIERILADVACFDDLGHQFGGGLTAREIDYLIQHEWARTAEDILWRRSKLGLMLTQDQIGEVERYLERLE